MLTLSRPGQAINTTIQLSGSKSISNRMLILGQVLKMPVLLQNLSDSEDTALLQNALLQINSNNKASIDVGHAGSDLRFLTALLSVTEGEWLLTGSERLRQRPVAALVDALRSLGASISYLENENFPPLKINGKKLSGGRVEIDSGISSQFISALLLISPTFSSGMELHLTGDVVSAPYIHMTTGLLKSFGCKLLESANQINVLPGIQAQPNPVDFYVESDWSSASYWYSICALSPLSDIRLRHFGKNSLQADAVLPELFARLGVETVHGDHEIRLSNKAVAAGNFSYDFTNCPDIAQTLAVTCFALGIGAELKGLKTLRIKETDRISAITTELMKFGASVRVSGDAMYIEPAEDKKERQKQLAQLSEVLVHTYNDHRMAMSFAPLAMLCGSLCFNAPAVVGKSYTAFWEDLKRAGFNVNLQP